VGPAAWRLALPEIHAIRVEAQRARGGTPSVGWPTDGGGMDTLMPKMTECVQSILIVYDGQDALCLTIAQALQHCFIAVCSFVDSCDGEALAAALQRIPGVPEQLVHRRSGVSAVLNDGIVIQDCERHPKILLFELRYHMTTMTADRVASEQRDLEWLLPLRELRLRGSAARSPLSAGGVPGLAEAWPSTARAKPAGAAPRSHWWSCKEGLRLVAGSLDRNKYAVCDDFLDEDEMSSCSSAARKMFDSGQMISGLSEQQNVSHGSFWSSANEGDFLNSQLERRKWTLHGDHRVWCGDRDPRVPALGRLTGALDALLAGLRGPE
ncbi:unnamed protein product, partial [Polarella glacialis]